MAASTTVTLDLTAPDAALSIEAGASVTSDVDVDIAITSAAADKSQMKIYGDVDDAFATGEYRALEANAPWIAFSATKTIRLSAGNAVKTVRVKVRDDVFNVSSEAADTITLDTSIPVISITVALTPTKISKQATKDTATLTFESDVALDEWKVNLTAAAGDAHTAGTVIPETGGSNTQGTTLAAATPQVVTIKGVDLETAGAAGGPAAGGVAHIIKVFGKATSNQSWSVGAS
jgi:hypothetical protein